MKIILVITVLLLMAVWWLYMLKQAWTPQIYQRTDFTDEERETIMEILGDEFENAQIDGLELVHAKDTANYIYVSNIDQELIKEHYTYSLETYVYTFDGEKISAQNYQHNEKYRTECYIYETETGTKAVIEIQDYSEELWNIAGTDLRKTELFFLITVLILIAGFGCYVIKRGIDDAKSQKTELIHEE